MKLFYRPLTWLCWPAIWFLTAVWILFTSPPGHAQEDVKRLPFIGTEVLRFILLERGLKDPLTSLDKIENDPKRTVLIILGNMDSVYLGSDQLRDFVADGGAMLVATDQRSSDALRVAFGIQVTGNHLMATDKKYAYREFDLRSPWITEFDREPDHPLARGIDRIATNAPSYLENVPDDFHLLARFSHVRDMRGIFEDFGRIVFSPPPFAVFKEDSHVLVLADQKVFVNGMILRTDNDNFDFAYNCIDWLRESGQRNKVLFIENGKIITEFPHDLFSPVKPKIPAPAAALVNQLVAGLERENFFDKMIYDTFPLGQILRVVSLILTTGLILLCLYRLVRARYRIESQAPLFAVSVSLLAPSLAWSTSATKP